MSSESRKVGGRQGPWKTNDGNPKSLAFAEQRKKWIAEYQAKGDTWQFKETIEERIQAWREEQELASQARCSQLFEMPVRKRLTEEKLERYIEETSEWLGLDTSEVRKWFIPKEDKP